MPGQARSSITLALIDDDELVRMAWRLVAKREGHHILVFSSVDEFHEVEIPMSTPIYVDYDLGGGVRGTDVARSLLEKGFTAIYLTTGFSPGVIDVPDRVLGIIGKDYPGAFADSELG